MKIYDVVIAGAGPAGLTAAIFAKRSGLDAIVIESIEQLSNLAVAHTVENYPGFEKISGMKLISKMKKQVETHGVDIKLEKIVGFEKKSDIFTTKTENNQYKSRALIIAMGLRHRKGSIDGEDKFFGKGVHYCTACDGPLYRGKDVMVIGGGDSAVKAAVMLREMGARKIYLVHRRDELRAEKIEQEKLKKSNVSMVLNSVAERIEGKIMVETVAVKNLETNKTTKMAVSGVFIEIGSVPITELARGIGIKHDANGFIITNEKKETNVAGVFAAGDITNGPLKQIVAAVSDGAIAAISASRFIEELKK